MPTVVEKPVPYHQSLLWRMHDGYFARRGGAAWWTGEIPSGATSNFALARQHARLVVKAARELERSGRLAADEPLWVLEIGSGSGRSAAHFLRALDGMRSPFARSIARRLRYVMSDYAEKSLRDAVAQPALAFAAAAGRLLPALFDLRRPGPPLRLGGEPIAARFHCVIASYVCCVSPVKVVRRDAQGWQEKFLGLTLAGDPVDDGEVVRRLVERSTDPQLRERLELAATWQPVVPELLFPDGPHAAILRETLEPLASGAVAYPWQFFDLVRGLGSLVVDEGLILVSDFGEGDAASLAREDAPPAFYGNTLNHGVAFPLFDAFARHAGLAIARTRDPYRAVHSVALRRAAAMSDTFRAAFQLLYVDHPAGEDFLDYTAAARAAVDAGDRRRAARLFDRCLRLDPDDLASLFALGQCHVELGRPDAALAPLERGRTLDRDHVLDFDFEIGRAAWRLGRLDEARAAFERSLARGDNAATRANLGRVLEAQNEFRLARAAYQRAIALEPRYERARVLLAELEHRWADLTLGSSG